MEDKEKQAICCHEWKHIKSRVHVCMEATTPSDGFFYQPERRNTETKSLQVADLCILISYLELKKHQRTNFVSQKETQNQKSP
jgi:hypothetical protein